MNRLIYIIVTILTSVQLSVAQSIHYEYWIDNNYDDRNASSSSANNITLSIDISQLFPGVHYLNFQTINSKTDQRGGIARYLFVVQDVARFTSLCEYWFDNDYQSRKVINGNSAFDAYPFDISHLPSGLHYFNFRTRSVSGAWGKVARYLFITYDDTSSMVCYEYWFDNDYEGRTERKGNVSTSNMPINIAHLTPGLHYLNFRTQSAAGSWSALAHYLFMVDNDITDIKEVEYWIDNEKSKTVNIQTVSDNIEFVIDINGLETEVTHTLNLIGKSHSGEIALSDFYEFTIDATGIIDITKCDGDEEVKVYNLNGALLKVGKRNEILKALSKGIYIVNGRKMTFK